MFSAVHSLVLFVKIECSFDRRAGYGNQGMHG